ncbi:MAG TPA: hypothetical protein PK765_07730 [bacterium]|nr:hypothetical protein [bacterium]
MAASTVLQTLITRSYTGDVPVDLDRELERWITERIVEAVAETPTMPEQEIATSPLAEDEDLSGETTEAGLEKTSESVQETAKPEDTKRLTKEDAAEIIAGEKAYKEALAFVKDAIAPAMMKIDSSKIQIGDVLIRSYFAYAYPDFLE